jgi:predicted oxidoreductase
MVGEAIPGTLHQPDDCDVLVVGSGIAGLSAAIVAAELGSRVLVLESEDSIGGVSAISGAACCVVGTPLQQEQGIVDTVDLALNDWVTTGGPSADLEWAERYLADSLAEVYEWCEDLGVRWSNSIGQAEGNSVPRLHLPVGYGRAVVDAAVARARQLGVRTEVGAVADRLILDADRVAGVRATIRGVRLEVRAGAVIVCTGGFAGNHDLVMELAPRLRSVRRVLSGSGPTARGGGRSLLDCVDAQYADRSAIWVYPNGTPDPDDESGKRGIGVRALTDDIWLNSRGERFHDESLRGGASGTAAILGQPGQTAWTVFNESSLADVLLNNNEYWATPGAMRPGAMDEFFARSRYAWRADSAGELASLLDMPAGGVIDTFAEFNSAIDGCLDTEPKFGRSLAGLRRIDGPGLIAIQYFPMAHKNFGGVRTGPDCGVLATSGEPIAGLFAAGEVAGMAGGNINGRAGLEGTMFGPSVYSGKVAGRAAADTAAPMRSLGRT